ncbi:MAG TPA: hypothetical protein VEV13_03770 [Candidatus Limnocylindria bacterium]|nr:hypothetical protein [Candidatus Limnocylindria bacterium]
MEDRAATGGPELPGLLVRRPLGRGAAPPWLAHAADGRWVVVRQAARPPRLPEHSSLLPNLGAVADAARASWVVSAFVAGGGLDRRLERTGPVGPEVVAGWASDLGGALSALHAAGLAHGDVQPSRVLLGPRDRVLLDATCARPASPEQCAADRAGLADLLARVSSGSLPRRSAGATRTLVGVLVALALVLAAAVVGIKLAGRPPQPAALQTPSPSSSPRADPPPQPAPTRAEPDWAAVLGALDEARGRALAAADVSLLTAVDAAGSEASARDRALVAELRRRGVTAQGWSTVISSARPLSASSRHVVLSVRDTASTYVLRTASGVVVARRPARDLTTWTVRLAATADGWRVTSVDQPKDPSSQDRAER